MELDRRVVLLVVTLTSFLTPFSSSSFNVALPSISREFSLDAVTMSWASLAYLLTCAMFLVPFGRLADIYGRRRVFLWGTLAFSLTSLLLGIYPSAQLIIWFRALQGFATAMIFGTGIAILVTVTPLDQKGVTLGVNAASVYVGLSVGPFLGGFLTQNFGWRSIFYVSAGVGAFATVMILLKLKGEWSEAAGENFDFIGSAVYSLTLLCLMYGFSLLPSIESLAPIILGLVFAGYFLWIEAKAKYPIIDIRLFQNNKAFSFGNIAALINFSSTFAVMFLLSLFLQYLKGLTPQEAGIILIASPIVQAVFSPLSGKLSDRMDPVKISAVGMAVTSLGLGAMSLLNESTPITTITASLGILGIGLALFSSPNTNVIMSSVDRRLYGVASSTLGTMRLLGQMLSQGIAMIFFAVKIGRLEISPVVFPQLMESIRGIFTLFVALSLLGVIISLVDNRRIESSK